MNKLNEQKFLNEINERWKNKNCPMCVVLCQDLVQIKMRSSAC